MLSFCNALLSSKHFNIEITNLLNTNYFRKVAFSEEITFNDNLLNGNIYAVDMNKTRRNI